MSELVLGGVAATAVAACAAAAGAVVGVGYLGWKAVGWLSDRAKAELDRLDADLGKPVAHASAVEARTAFKRYQALAKASAMKHPELKQHAGVVARMVAARKSAVASFLTEQEWQHLAKPETGERAFVAMLERATQRMVRANTSYVSRAIVAAAADAGFTAKPQVHDSGGKQTLVIHDPQGRALVADVIESDAGAKVTLDLTGFGDGSCHAVMDRVLKGLEERQVRLAQAQRRSHYSRDGFTAPAQKHAGARRPASGSAASQDTQTRGRKTFYGTERSRLAR
jgi:hypothetical protein